MVLTSITMVNTFRRSFQAPSLLEVVVKLIFLDVLIIHFTILDPK